MFRSDFMDESGIKLPSILRISAIIFFLTFIIGVVIHLLEPDAFPTVFDGLWWSIVTISTVGYGDFVPQGVIGRILGVVLIISGITLFSLFITELASSAVSNRDKREKGRLSFHRSGHFIIVGWNERSKQLLKHLVNIYPKSEFVLVDATLHEIPKNFQRLNFVKGSPMVDETFKRANIKEAHTIIITANSHIEEKTADMNTVVTLLTAKGMNSSIYSIVELLTSDQQKNIDRAGADEVIESSKQVSLLMTNGIANHGMTDVVSEMLQHKKQNQLQFSQLPPGLIDACFADAIHELQNEDCFLLGIFRDGETILHPQKSSTLLKGDKLIFFIRSYEH
ncbi:NAD-binding protein [Bacillus shivajii]|uniref:potassium channel family protein n=1 Tax=Bacillus shivajii TaxID=1983719 RepID=UPI001CF9F0BF|nr:potassium channel protein [Bacillus shivajii]UCZ52506.1 NAD-binding protein [Bacillus shivajii]